MVKFKQKEMNNMRQMYGTKAMRIVKFIIQETGTYEDQFRRPYQTNLTAQSAKEFVEQVDGSKFITAGALAGISGQFIRPMATPESDITIVNGWGQKRLRFFLEIRTEDHIGNFISEYIVGYTDHPGLSMSNILDPQMCFFINAVNITNTSYQQTPLGNQTYQNVIDSSHLLVNDVYTGHQGINKLYGLRPEDVFSEMQGQMVRTELAGEFLADTRSHFTGDGKKSKRTNAIAPMYAADLLDSYNQTKNSEPNIDQDRLLGYAINVVQSSAVADDPFLTYLRNNKPMQVGACNSFTLQDLQSLDANVGNVTHVLNVTPEQLGGMSQRGIGTSHWGGSDSETLFATVISQSVPGYMLQYSLNKIHFSSTNQEIGGKINTIISMAKSFSENIDISKYIQAFIFKIQTEMLKSMSYNGQIGFQIEVMCDLLGETWINISINGGPQVTFVTPSFCDALMSPVITRNELVLNSISSDFDSLMSNLSDSKPGFADSRMYLDMV
jgi:hypothetical protein